MKYEQRLIAAAELVIAGDRCTQEAPLLDPAKLGVSATLKPHQIEGVSWLVRRYDLGVNVVLGDEMGLGKTLQAISLLSYLKYHLMSPGPFLVLCPLSVTDGWISEFTKFCPRLNVLRYVGEKGQRLGLRRMMYEHIQKQSSSGDVHPELPFDVLLTTYDIALLDQAFLSQIPWHYTVIDEAQRLKNPSSVLYNVLEQQFVMPRRLLMTGTPIQNNLSELWALMHFCMPSIFGTMEQFVSTFKEAGSSSAGQDAGKAKRQFKILKYILKAFMLRRTKALLVENGSLMLPPLTEITVMTPLSPLQKKVYMSILRRELPTLLSFSSTSSNHQSLQNIVIQLRKTCSHPYLFSGIEPEPYEEGEHLVQASGKLIVLDQLLKKLHAAGHRVLLFAQMTHTLDILQDFLELRKYTYERLDGSVRAEERFAAIRSFSSQPVKDTVNSLASKDTAFVFMISTRAGGVGLNLVAADTEEERIKQCRGRVFALRDEPEVARVWLPHNDSPGLAMARAFGDFCLKDFGLISVPEISYRWLTEKDEFIVLATDGVWDVLSNKEVVDIVASAPNRSSAARSLVELAVSAWRCKYPTSKVDDCAVVCLFLNNNSDDVAAASINNISNSMSNEKHEGGSLSAAEAAGSNDLMTASSDQSESLLGECNVKGRGKGGELTKGQAKTGPGSHHQTPSDGNTISVVGGDEWSALEGVSRENTMLTLPRFTVAGEKRLPGSKSKKLV